MNRTCKRGDLLSILFVAVCLASTASHCLAAAPQEAHATGPVIGIDLGTTYSCVGVWKNGGVEIIANDQGNRITPSYVAFTDDERLIGDAAKNQATVNPLRTIYDVKRLMGRKFNEPDVQRDRKLLSYKIIDRNEKPYISLEVKGEQKLLSPEEVSAMILSKMKETAEAYLGHPVHRAVVTVPAYFTNAQRKATEDAGLIAGLKVERIINEPTAAAVAYGLDKGDAERTVIVFDLGGGTFDVSVLDMADGVFEVKSTHGDTHLGGEDFDQRVMEYFMKLVKRKYGKDMSGDARAKQKLRREVERAKRALSSQHQVRVEVESLFEGVDLSEPLTRARFEELNMDLFKKTLAPMKKALADAKKQKSDIDEIVLVGGSTRIPKVQEMLRDFFEGKGATKGINPDEAVACGAAIQGAALSGDAGRDLPLLVDIASLSLGIETAGGVMAPIINRGTAIPSRKSQAFTTHQDQQTTVTIRVYEGERAMTKDNNLLGQFDLTGIPPAPQGVPQIEVTFELNANGILNVSAQDKGTGRREAITIKAKNGGTLSKEEIERMVKEAEEYADEDKRAKAKVDARNHLESYCYSVKSSLDGKLKGQVSEEDVSRVREEVDEALQWLEENGDSAEADEIQERMKGLEDVAGPVMAKAYQQGGEGGEEEDLGSHDEL